MSEWRSITEQFQDLIREKAESRKRIAQLEAENAALYGKLDALRERALRLYRRAWDVQHLLPSTRDDIVQTIPEWPAALRVFRCLLMGLENRIDPNDEALLIRSEVHIPDWLK